MKKSERISASLKKNEAELKKRFSNCFDVVLRDVEGARGRRALVVFADGMADKELIQSSVISPLLGFAIDADSKKISDLRDMSRKLLPGLDISEAEDMSAAVTACLSGDTLVFADGFRGALVLQTRKWPSRSISPPETQRSVRGSKEGFTETLLFNVALLRRRIKSPELKTEIIRTGRVTATDVCLVYMRDRTSTALIDELRSRLKAADVDYVLESGHIEQLIEDKKRTLFATTGNNEKPDVTAAKLLKGRAAIIVDGSPFVLTAPMLFSENFQSPEDFYSRPFYANFLRVLRFIAYFVTLTLPAVYVALALFHNDMIPDRLLNTLISASEGVPLSLAPEMLMMLIIYELLREAMLRLPSAVGASVGLVGVLIIGEAAVGIHLIGAPTVVIAALTFITSAVVSPLTDSSALIRLLLLLLAACAGLYGVLLGLFLTLVRLCALTSYGCPYMLPIAPVRLAGIGSDVLRLDIHKILGGKNG